VTPARPRPLLTEPLLASAAIEQATLRRVAVAIAKGIEPQALFGLVAREVAQLHEADAAAVVRFEPTDPPSVLGAVGLGPKNGRIESTRGDGAVARVRRCGRAVRVDDYGAAAGRGPAHLAALGFRGGMAAPIWVGGRVWGAIGALSRKPAGFAPRAEGRLAQFTDLVAIAIANVEARAELLSLAATDPLTSAANHRCLHEQLGAEVERTRRHRGVLSLVVVGLDRFAEANQAHGHRAGDRVLSDLARRLQALVRSKDLVARIGGDRFALLLPETDLVQARLVAERALEAIRAEPLADVGPLRASAGVCDLGAAGSAEEIVRLAEGALYWAKSMGGDRTACYREGRGRELSAREGAERLTRQQALSALRALSRAVDAKDPSTLKHSERVAEMSARLATALGWSAERTGLLFEAALLHDVGKIGVPDAILLKPGRLTAAEYEQVKVHPVLGAQIASEVLRPEQVAWIRSHHERADGRGYPDGLAGEDIPDGARILAVADAWDAMTIARPYSEPMLPAAALAECHRAAQAQFCPRVVSALGSLHEAGAIECESRHAAA
jgi:diguanylate cyclase (GGDEF)-like protein/putative nucleotidyltransferase with HDIG domain